MVKSYDICLIDYFPNSWLTKLHKNAIVWDVIDRNVQVIDDSENMPRGHGIAVLDIMQKVNPDAMICVIPVTNNTTIHEINYILSQIIHRNTARIVNISCGFYTNNIGVEILEMERLFRCAKEHGIHIVCAKSNDGAKTYPTECNLAIPVWGEHNCSTDISFTPDGVVVRYISLYTNWCDNKKIWVHGNSFFAPIVSSLFSKCESSKYGDLCLDTLKYTDSLRFESLLSELIFSYRIIDF